MRFTFVILLLCSAHALVSALPLARLSTEVIPREYDVGLDGRSLDWNLVARARLTTGKSKSPGPSSSRRPSTRKKKLGVAKQSAKVAAKKPARKKNAAIPHQVDLHISKPPNKPEKEHWSLRIHPQGNHDGNLHTLHAISDKSKAGVLQGEFKDRGKYTPSTGSNPDLHIADFDSKSKAHAAGKDVVKNVKLTQTYPNQNCVDYTCRAVDHMVSGGHIPGDAPGVAAFHKIYNDENERVRQATNTAANRANAGVPGGPQAAAGPSHA